MAKKFKLDLEEDYEFDLIGICSSYSDYRLCWDINQILDLSLVKTEDYTMENKKDGEYFFSFYEYINNDTQEEFYLLKNQSFDFKKLIPEQDKIDYFIIIKNNYEIEIDDLIEKLKTLESVSTAFSFNVDDLKSKSNLVF